MIGKREKRDDKRKKKIEPENKKNQFNIAEVIIIMIITAICAITITIKVSYAINKTSKKIKTEAELSELINVYNSINDEYYQEVDKKELINSAIGGMLGFLKDPYTVLLSETEAENLNKELEGEYIGMGAEISSYTNDSFVVSRVYDNSPASDAGLKVNDKIIKINSDSLSGKNINDLSSLLKLKNGEKVSITVLRDKEELELSITIGKVELNSVEYQKVNINEKKVYYIKIKTFAKNTYKQFKNVIDQFKNENADGIILDLRNNTGGHVAVAQSISELFLNKNDVVYQLKNKDKTEKIINLKDKTVDTNIVVLVNSQTASASEILTASLKDNLEINVIGVKTYGKGKVQKMKALNSGLTVKYTVQSWLTPKGIEIDGNGIEPTIEIKLNSDYKNNPVLDNDNQYKKAMETIKTLINK